MSTVSNSTSNEPKTMRLGDIIDQQMSREKKINAWLRTKCPSTKECFSYAKNIRNLEFYKPAKEAAYDLFKEEISVLEPCHDDQVLFERLVLFASLHFKGLLTAEELEVIEFMEGSREIGQLHINSQNAKSYLRLVKIIDLALIYQSRLSGWRIKSLLRSTDAIRTRILEVCSPFMTTAEAYTKTVSADKVTSWDYLQRPNSWTASRNGHQAKWLANECSKAIGLAKRFNDPCPIMIVTQGNTAAGKSTAITQEIEPMLKDNGSTDGILNPDSCKMHVKHTGNLKGVPLTNQQVHFEGYSVFENYHQELAAKDMICVVDKRFGLTLDKNQKPISCIDLDVPLRTSLIRNLLRNPFGKDPCVVLEAVTSGFMQIRCYRAKMMETLRTEPQIKKYKLYHTDEYGKKQLVAKKENGVFEILSQVGFKECMRIPSTEEIEKVAKQEITPEFVDSVVGKDIPVEQKPMLERWLGFTLEEALKRRVNGSL